MPDLSKRIVYRVNGMDRVQPRRGIVYRREGSEALTLDLYAPPDLPADARRPAIVFVHGGPIPADMPAPTSWGIFQSYGELAAASGFVGLTLNHRLHSWSDHERATLDLEAAIDYVRAHASELLVEADRIAIWAFSGGGPLLCAPLRKRAPHLRCLLAFYAMLDLRPFLPPDADAATQARAQTLAAATHLKGNGADPPMFIARAGRDAATINHGIDDFVAAALAANAPLVVHNHPTGQHSFDALDDDDWSREIIRSAMAFVAANI